MRGRAFVRSLLRACAGAVALAGAALAVVPACGVSCEEVELVVASAGAGPGELRTALRLGLSPGHVAARPGGGVACATCSGLLLLEPAGREDDRLDTPARPRLVAIGPDETAYTSVLSDREGIGSYDVVALAPGGALRWQTALADGEVPMAIAAGGEAVYLEIRSVLGGTAPHAVIALDAATGAIAWTRAERMAGAAARGVFTVEEAEAAVTLRHRDPVGAAAWERTLTSAGAVFAVRDAVATPDGGGIFAGRAGAAVDLGDRQLVAPAGGELQFIVAIDAAGATRWTFEAEVSRVEHVALTARGELLLAGRLESRGDDSRVDSFVALATAEGIVRTHRIGGTASQLVLGLHAAPDGAAWVHVSSEGGEGEPAPSLQAGGHRLDGPGAYLLEVGP